MQHPFEKPVPTPECDHCPYFSFEKKKKVICIYYIHAVPKEARRGSGIASLGAGVTGPLKRWQALLST